MNDDSTDHPPSASDVSSLPSARRVLRFLRIGSRAEPFGFVNLDKAIDQVGREMFAQDWVHSLSLKHFPFQYEKKRRAFYRYDYGGSLKHPLISERVTPQTLQQRRDWRRIDRQYRKVRSRLRGALENGHVGCRLYTPEGDLLEPSLTAFASQLRRIFYCGVMWATTPIGKRNCRVLIDKHTLQTWLGRAVQVSPELPPSRKTGLTTFLPLIKIIADDAQENRYKLPYRRFDDLLTDVAEEANVKLSKSAIGDLWSRDAASEIKFTGRHRPPKMDGENFERARSKLIEKLVLILAEQ
ncbi:hypothetical protein [Mesorhizobium sp. CN2-181]|uniref:hypothetical protein n=1 Tax=Mesorhizobium yinganensis TaxID=3157707 RepID=UPI0032B73428